MMAYIVVDLTVDDQARAAYLRVGFYQEDEVLTTIPAQANLDVNEQGVVVGIEILDWPS